MGPCACGHSPEEHEQDGTCDGEVQWRGEYEPCRCVSYDEAEPEVPAPGPEKALSGWIRAPRRRLLHYFARPAEDETKWYALCGVYKQGDQRGEVRATIPRCSTCERMFAELAQKQPPAGPQPLPPKV